MMGNQLSKLEQFLRCVQTRVMMDPIGACQGEEFTQIISVDELDLPDGPAEDAAKEYLDWKYEGGAAPEPAWHRAWKERIAADLPAASRAIKDAGLHFLDVKNCKRCGLDHPRLGFWKHEEPIDGFTHWAVCPISRGLVMMTVKDGPDEAQPMLKWLQ